MQENEDMIYICKGRIQGEYPIYLLFNHNITGKIIENAHKETLHGGVVLTMAKVGEDFWVPKLRSVTKQIRKNCYGCTRCQLQPAPIPSPGNLPLERSEGNMPFSVVGVDFAGPIKCKGKGKSEVKSYIILYTCTLTRGIHIELLSNATREQFLSTFKRFIAVRGRSTKIISDNGSAFIAASKRIRNFWKLEKMHDYLAKQRIHWQFNLSQASWWGGMFERMISIVKTFLYKAIGSAKLTFCELQEVALDIQLVLNNRRLTYCEDDIEMPLLTPNLMIFGISNFLLNEDPSDIESKDLRKRAKYIRKCKEAL